MPAASTGWLGIVCIVTAYQSKGDSRAGKGKESLIHVHNHFASLKALLLNCLANFRLIRAM